MSEKQVSVDTALETLLDQERINLLNGGLEKIAPFTEEKARLVNLLLQGRAPDEKYLARIKKKAERNQKLLAAAVRAVRSVNGRMNANRAQGKSLNTYTRSGRMRQLGDSTNSRYESRV